MSQPGARLAKCNIIAFNSLTSLMIPNTVDVPEGSDMNIGMMLGTGSITARKIDDS